MSFDPSLPEDGINVTPTHPLRDLFLLVAGVVAAGAVLVVGIALVVDLVVPRLPTGLEVRLFGGLGEAGEDAADPRAAVVSALLERMARHWPESPYRFRIRVWDEEAPNALAFPGGLIVVTSGLLEQVESENELAFVLGHELGHFHNRDHLRGLGRGLALALVLGAVSATGAGGVADLASVAGGLAQRGFDRDQERAADRFGLSLVATEYGHVANAGDFFARLPEPEGLLDTRLGHYLATHPRSNDRVAALRELAASEGWAAQGAATPLSLPPAPAEGDEG